MREVLYKRGLLALLEIKDSDIRITTIRQGWDAVDHGIHIGGAMSMVVPLVSLYYGGFMELNIEQPTEPQDMFVLSKGHGVATLASVYADLGYFDRDTLLNSRSRKSILNGHPGPILPGVHLSTGPMGQGICVGAGLAAAGKRNPKHDVFVITGDGELQEGTVWEAAMYAGASKLDNFCVIVDKNMGQLDDPKQNIFPMDNVAKQFEAFGFQVYDVDGSEYASVLEALESFKRPNRNGRPAAIICNSKKGFGAFSGFLIKHKVNLSEELTREELRLQSLRRAERVGDLFRILEEAERQGYGPEFSNWLSDRAKAMNLNLNIDVREAASIISETKTKPAAVRDKRIRYDDAKLPAIEKGKEYQASSIVTEAMKVFALDERAASVDADLGSTSGLEGGVGWRDGTRALNVGIAEANMMCIGEALAIKGRNVWVSTFCPFFNWNVLRRIAIGQQERFEAMETNGGWLTEGHELDITFLATAPNFETQTNGATHMGNDDIQVFRNVAHLRIIDISCPKQLLEAMKWIMEGRKGLVYLRILRAASGAIYGPDYRFEYGKGYYARGGEQSPAAILTSGRGVYEAIAASEELSSRGIECAVIDMPSIDEELLWELSESGRTVLMAEQNNGFIWDEFRRIVFERGGRWSKERIAAINTLAEDGSRTFIHSATYGELLRRFNLNAAALSERILLLHASAAKG